MKKQLFGSQIEPACEYCHKGHKTMDGQMVLCKSKGVVAPYYSCRKFDYDPLKRIPLRPQPLPEYSQEDFKL